MSKKIDDHQFDSLRAILLDIGGHEVVEFPEPHLKELIERGRVFEEQIPEYIEGDAWIPHQCHRNVSLYYMGHRSCQIVTGYLLSGGGAWVQHSCLWNGSTIVEPFWFLHSAPGDSRTYFGTILDKQEAVKFVVSEMPNLIPGFGGWRQIRQGRRASKTEIE